MRPKQIRRVTRLPVLCLALVVGLGCHCTAKRQCKFDGLVDSSAVQLCFLGVCPAPFSIVGEIGIDCTSKLLAGERDCACSLKNIEPFAIAGVGTVCIEPHGTCANGRLDCDGGSGLDVDLNAHAQLGACTDNADCASQCAAHCNGLGKTVYDAGCESFCQSGTRENLPCICDDAASAACAGGIAGVNDCPGGSCEGRNNELDTDCHCTCVRTGAGAANAGTIGCEIGLRVRIEQDPICDGAQVLVHFLEPPCVPFTSGTATSVVADSNEQPFPQGPYSETGSSATCSALDQGVMTDYELVAVVPFLDTTIGDTFWRFTADCQ